MLGRWKEKGEVLAETPDDIPACYSIHLTESLLCSRHHPQARHGIPLSQSSFLSDEMTPVITGTMVYYHTSELISQRSESNCHIFFPFSSGSASPHWHSLSPSASILGARMTRRHHDFGPLLAYLAGQPAEIPCQDLLTKAVAKPFSGARWPRSIWMPDLLCAHEV